MKKTFFVVLTVLLALSLATCDLFEEAAPAGEEGFVTLTIGVASDPGLARSLTLTNAQQAASVDFYEVAFYRAGLNPVTVRSTAAWNGTALTPAGGSAGDPWKVDIPIADYSNGANKAVLFAGLAGASPSDPKILVAIGVLNTASENITPITTSISFELTALKSTLANFSVVGETAGPVSQATFAGDFSSTTYSGAVYPLEVNQKYDLDYEFTVPFVSLTYLGTSGFVTNTAYGADADATVNTVPVTVTGATLAIPSSGAKKVTNATPKNDTITLTLQEVRGTTAGLCKLDIHIPIYAINISGNKQTWNITGGLNDDLDNGTTNSTGGAILLSINPTTVNATITNPAPGSSD